MATAGTYAGKTQHGREEVLPFRGRDAPPTAPETGQASRLLSEPRMRITPALLVLGALIAACGPLRSDGPRAFGPGPERSASGAPRSGGGRGLALRQQLGTNPALSLAASQGAPTGRPDVRVSFALQYSF